MSIPFAIAVFLGSTILSLVSSLVLAAGVDRIGLRLKLAPGLLGVVTALAANAPEISSAVTATAGGRHELGVAVVLGSNVFNLAALLGLSAIVAGRVAIGRGWLLLGGLAAVAVLGAVAALLFGLIAPWPALGIAGSVFAAYVVLAGLRPEQIRRVLPPGRIRSSFGADRGPAPIEGNESGDSAGRGGKLAVVPALAAIVLASVGMVHAAVALADHWRIPQRVVGTLIIATLTGIPNAIAAVRLALAGKGAAVVSETLNSNTLNLLAGVCLPAVALGFRAPSSRSLSAVGWLAGMTLVALALTGFRGRIGRWGGGVLVGIYGAFVAWILWR